MRDGRGDGAKRLAEYYANIEAAFPRCVASGVIPIRCAAIDCDRTATTEADGCPVCSRHAGESAASLMDRLMPCGDATWAEAVRAETDAAVEESDR